MLSSTDFWKDRLAIAGSAVATQETLVALLLDPHAEVRTAAACNPKTPQRAIESAIIEYEEARVITAVLKGNPKISGQCLQDIWAINEHSHAVLIAICSHPKILPDMAFRITKDPESTHAMLHAIAQNPAVPQIVKANIKAK